MPSITELIDLRERTMQAQQAAEAAQTAEQAARDALTPGQDEYSAAAQRAAEAQARLDQVNAAVAQLSAAQAEVQAVEQDLAEKTAQLDALNQRIAEIEAALEQELSRAERARLQRILEQLRNRQPGLVQQQQEAQDLLAQAQEHLARLQAEADQIGAAQQAAEAARQEVTRLEDKLAKLEQAWQEASARAAVLVQRATDLKTRLDSALEQLIVGLKTNVPVMFLPVRLETRFHTPSTSSHPTELRIRIYPDDIHQDTHELGLTKDEEQWGKHFWQQTWRAGLAPRSDAAYPERYKQELAAWQQLAARFGPTRAAYIARQLTPTNEQTGRPQQNNLDRETPLAAEPEFDPSFPRRDSSWSRASLARALPDRWLAIGYRGQAGEPGFLRKEVWGNLIPSSLHTGPDPSFSSNGATQEEKVRGDPGMRWMVDFDKAEAVGMGIRMPFTADEAANGFDRLIVLGVKGSLQDPAGGARELSELIELHRFTWGCGFVPVGTPTNNSELSVSGYSHQDVGFQTSFALERDQPRIVSGDRTEGERTARALGLDLAQFARLRYAERRDGENARCFNRLLWPVTLGYYLDQFFNEVMPGYSGHEDEWRDYFVDWVRGRGPLSALRFGRQPYGLLPVTSLDRWASNQMDLVDLLRSLRGLWRTVQYAAAYAGRDSAEIGRDLVETLGLQAISSSYSWRWARGPDFFKQFWGFPGQGVNPEILYTAVENLRVQIQNVLQRIGLPLRDATRLGGMTFARVPSQWKGSLVDEGPVSETEPLKQKYIHALLDHNVSLDEIHQETHKEFPSGQPKPLLYQLLRQATLLAYAQQVLHSSPWPQWRTSAAPPWFEPELVDMDMEPPRDVPGDPLKTLTFWRLLKLFPSGATRSLGDQLREKGLEVDAPLREFLDSLRQIADLPTADLQRLLSETLDLVSHRLDAWITSLATHRLNEFRNAEPHGVYLGGYGWVENLRPRPDPSLSDGYVHAPSMAQAVSAAVLRSGYLTHKEQKEGASLKIDLSSKRVRLALELIDGVRQGQPLGALLGYRFERTLPETDLELKRMIYSLRERAPLTGGQLVPKDSSEAQEAIAANNVVDGLKLLELYQKGGNTALFADLALAPEQKSAIVAAIIEIQDAVDAIGDLSMTESIYQAVQGNYLRAGATLDAVSRGETPAEIQVLKTPQPGVAFTQRLIALFNVSTSENSTWNRERARARAEPTLNAWAERLLVDPAKVRCTAEYFKPDHDPFQEEPDDKTPLTLAMLGLCALDVVYSLPITYEAQQTELELRLGREALKHLPNGMGTDARVNLVFTRNETFDIDEMTFPELFEFARILRELITNGRAVDGRDLSMPGSGASRGGLTDSLKTQLNDVEAMWILAKKELEDLFTVHQSGTLEGLQDNALEKLRTALEKFSAFAIQSAVPRSEVGDSPEEQQDLIRQAQNVYTQILDVENRLKAINGPNVSDALAKLTVLFGESFRVLLPFKVEDEFDAAMKRRKQAQDAEPDKVILWLQTVAGVREPARRLNDVLTYSHILQTHESMTLRVAQFPVDNADAWNILQGSSEHTGATSIVVYADDHLDPTQPMAGLMLDEWVEAVPQRTLQTALAFHYDAPAASAPQSILLAISPDPARAWDPPTFEAIINETLDLARLRTVDYDSLPGVGHILPGLLVANNVGGDSHGDTISSEFAE